MKKFFTFVMAMLFAVPAFAGSVSDINKDAYIKHIEEMQNLRKKILAITVKSNKTPQEEVALKRLTEIFEAKSNNWQTYLERVAEDGTEAELPAPVAKFEHCHKQYNEERVNGEMNAKLGTPCCEKKVVKKHGHKHVCAICGKDFKTILKERRERKAKKMHGMKPCMKPCMHGKKMPVCPETGRPMMPPCFMKGAPAPLPQGLCEKCKEANAPQFCEKCKGVKAPNKPEFCDKCKAMMTRPVPPMPVMPPFKPCVCNMPKGAMPPMSACKDGKPMMPPPACCKDGKPMMPPRPCFAPMVAHKMACGACCKDDCAKCCKDNCKDCCDKKALKACKEDKNCKNDKSCKACKKYSDPEMAAKRECCNK